MQMNVQMAVPTSPLSMSADGSTDASRPRKVMSARRRSLRDRFDYRLIFGASLLVVLWIGLLERCNPMFWRSSRATAAKSHSLWAASKEAAHHYATISFQG